MTSLRIDGATVWTGRHAPDGSILTTDSILLGDGRIVALGDTGRAMNADEVIDGSGAFVCPSFGDGHMHPVIGGLEHAFAQIRTATTTDDVIAAVKAWAEANPEAEWVRGDGLDITLAPNGVFEAAWLDAVIPDRPVYLHGSDGHTVWVNSEALRRAGYLAGVTQPAGGEIVLDAEGAPIGTLREPSAFMPVRTLLPPPSPEQARSALDHATARFAAAGITWVQDALQEPSAMPLWIGAAEHGALHVDVDLAIWMDPSSWRETLASLPSVRALIDDAEIPGLTATTVKFFADGIIESATGALLEPYCDCPTSLGIPNWAPDQMAEAMIAVDLLGFTIHVHAIGDAGVRVTLDAFEQVVATNPPRDRRWTIAHLQLVDETDIPRLLELGVIANFEPYWAHLDNWQRELNAKRLGEKRLNQQYRIGSFVRTGNVVSFGSDWPVTTFAPLECMQVAVTRQLDRDSKPWMPEECITVDQALTAYTRGIAVQSGRSDCGELRPGARADLVLLARDPRLVEPMTIGEIEVLGTWKAGQRTFG